MADEAGPWVIDFYLDDKGHSPVAEWLNGLHDPGNRIRLRIDLLLTRLRDSSGRLPEPYAKHLRAKLWELRWHIGSNCLRIIYSNVSGRIVLLLSGFTKQAQKTPPGEITLAQKRLEDWVERRERKKQDQQKA